MAFSVEEIIDAIVNGSDIIIDLSAPLPDDIASQLVQKLKNEVDRYWFIDSTKSLELANAIIKVGQARQDNAQIGLGFMARGDSWRFQGNIQPAWQDLLQSAEFFLKANDNVGWARTCIGRAAIASEMDAIVETLEDIARATEILMEHGEFDRLRRMYNATGVLYLETGDFNRALAQFHLAIAIAEEHPDVMHGHLGTVYMHIGYAYDHMGDFAKAISYYNKSVAIYQQFDQLAGAARAYVNIAFVERRRANYVQALQILYQLEVDVHNEPHIYAVIQRELAACNLGLNRYESAREQALEALQLLKDLDRKNDTARLLLHLAEIETRSGDLHAGLGTLRIAEPIFHSLNALSWEMLTHLREVQISLLLDNITMSVHDVENIVTYFAEKNYKLYHAEALLVLGRIHLKQKRYDDSQQIANRVLNYARQAHVAYLRYSAHLLSGQVSEQRHNFRQAVLRYTAASRIVEHVQRRLTLHLRANFMHDKLDAFQGLIRLYLQHDDISAAFSTIERAKAQVMVDYVNLHQEWRWADNSPDIQQLVDKLIELRREHHWWYWEFQTQNSYSPENNFLTSETVKPFQNMPTEKQVVSSKLTQLEREILNTQEQIELHRAQVMPRSDSVARSTLGIRDELTSDEVVLSYYIDDDAIHVFTISQTSIDYQRLAISLDAVESSMGKLQEQIRLVLTFESQTSTRQQKRTQRFQYICEQLYQGLIAPVIDNLHGYKHWTIIPYGILHYLPFHLLFNGSVYILEKHLMRIMPAASLITKPSTCHTPFTAADGLILAFSADQSIEAILDEADAVHSLLGGICYREHDAGSYRLRRSPGRVLHIAAHGEYHLDQPDLSYIQLSDGRLYMSDLLQHDLRYELVTLSACETGWSDVRPGDELMGLGRAFLYAGAQSVVASLWQVDDGMTAELMADFYRGLMSGQAKDEALQNAQKSFLEQNRWLHPAFWGAFQLVGSTDPISQSVHETQEKFV